MNQTTSNTWLTNNFRLAELTRTSCGLPNVPNQAQTDNLKHLATNYLQPLRDRYGPIRINSGFRTPEVNKAVGGAKNSAHMQGNAADIYVPSALLACLYVSFFHERYVKEGIGYDQLIVSYRRSTGNWWLHLGIASQSSYNRMQVKFLTY